MPSGTFDDGVIAAVAQHMNDDHSQDSLLIVQELLPAPRVTEVQMAHLDFDGVDYLIVDEGEPRIVRVPFASPALQRSDLRAVFVALYDQAVAARAARECECDRASERDWQSEIN